MVNTVGSYETKYWYRTLIPFKQSAILTPLQEELMIGSLLGDGAMRVGKGARNANFKVEQGLEQKEYVIWKYGILRPLVLTEPKISFRYRENKEKYPKSWWFRTIRHPLLTEMYQRFYTREGYRTGRKIIPIDIARNLTPLAFAVWIMDDGSYNNGKLDISTYSFSLDEITLLQNTLRDVFAIEARYFKDRDKGYRMYFSKNETMKAVTIIRPYVIDSMIYKIGFVAP